jgi:SAM-dependent methyltransferase
MNSTLSADDASILYCDSDYPSKDHGRFPENFDAVTEFQGVARDVDRYLEILVQEGGPILEVGCGTGRIGIALARAGHRVTGVDVSPGMLDRYRRKLERESAELRERIALHQVDAATMDVGTGRYAVALLAFNTLPCVTEAAAQQAVLECIARHLKPGGLLLIDLVNPLLLNLAGEVTPKPFFTRRNEWTGRLYTRFAMMGPMDADQRQLLHGWYDEIRDDGAIERRHYSITWRPLFRSEITLMLEKAHFEVERVEGGHRGEAFKRDSGTMFIWARRGDTGPSVGAK